MRNAKIQQTGVALIEVMVSVVILGLGLVGMAGLQARSLMSGQSSHYRSIAADLAADLADRIHANRSPFISSDDSAVLADAPPDFSKCSQVSSNKDTTTCTNQSTTVTVGSATRTVQAYRVANEISEWNTTLRAQLPNATWSFASPVEASSSSGYYRYALSITWLDDRINAANATYTVVIE